MENGGKYYYSIKSIIYVYARLYVLMKHERSPTVIIVLGLVVYYRSIWDEVIALLVRE